MVDVETFIEYVKTKDMGRMEYALLEAHFDINARDQNGCTALHHAVMQAIVDNDLEIVRFLVDRGADVNVKNESQCRETVLHIALQAADIALTTYIMESPNFDIVRCDALQRSRMLPGCCVIDDVHRHIAASNLLDSDCTLAKRRSFGDQFLLFVRQNSHEQFALDGDDPGGGFFVFPPDGSEGREIVRDLVIIQDFHLPPLSRLIDRFDCQTLTCICLVDCHVNADNCETVLERLALRTLVLSNTRLQRLPVGLFNAGTCRTLEVLKLDRNRLVELPEAIGSLTNLRTLCFDAQKPRLRTVPVSIAKLQRLQALSFTDNRIESLQFVTSLTSLRTLRASQNRIVSLPDELGTQLRDLMVLDVSHNRLDRIPPSFVDLARRLHRFDYFNLTLRPKFIRRDRNQLIAHLELERFLGSFATSGQRSVGDVTVALVGETHSGKSTLVAALKDEKGVCAAVKQELPQRRESFVYQTDVFDSAPDESGAKFSINTVVMANNILDNYSQQVRVDMYLLLVDLTSLELHNGSQHLIARHVTRLQTWLQTLYELAPDTPVLLVGTHAEQVRAVSFHDIWRIVQELLDQGRTHHLRHFSDSACPHCLLCAPRSSAQRHALAKSRTGHAGFVDLSFQHQSDELLPNGFIPNSLVGGTGVFGGVGGRSPGLSGSSGGASCSSCRFPHVVGYYEVDSKKIYPKDVKKSNLSVEQLRSAIVRLTRAAHAINRIPPSWSSFARHLATIRIKAPHLLYIPYEEVVSIARSFDIVPGHVPLMLRLFHYRGRLVFFDNDPTCLSRLVIIVPSWFVQKIHMSYDVLDRSRCGVLALMQTLTDKDFDRQLQRKEPALGTTSTTPTTPVTALPYSSRWLLSSFLRLEVCLPMGGSVGVGGLGGDSSTSSSSYGGGGGGGGDYLLFPNLLEAGAPRPDVWPDAPEWDEKQITCDFAVRTLKPAMFAELIQSLNEPAEGRRVLEIVSNPLPVFLSHHAVFFTGVDVGGCDDCYAQRQRLLCPPSAASSAPQHGGSGGVNNVDGACGGGGGRGHRNHVTTTNSDIVDEMCGGADPCEFHDDVLHKVHVQLHANLVAVRIHVRGISPCCAMKTVLGFIELYLDDVPDDWSETMSSSDKSSWNASSSDCVAMRRSSSSVASGSLHGGATAGARLPSGAASGESYADSDDDGDQRAMFLLCPKCVLLRHSKPERIVYQSTPIRRRAICNKWHNLGSWSRVATGNYHFSNVELLFGGGGSLQTSLPDYEHPRLALLLPPSLGVCQREWYVCSRMRFLEGFEVHFLCENPAYWHLTPSSGYRLNRSSGGATVRFIGGRTSGNQLQAILSLALPMIQVVQGVNEHAQNARMFSTAVAELVQMYEYLRNAEVIAGAAGGGGASPPPPSSSSRTATSSTFASTSLSTHDAYGWLTKNKDRLVAMLTKALGSASDGVPDLYFKAGSSIRAETVFQCHSTASREQLARYLRVDSSSTRFGDLRPIYVGREIRWVCDMHYEELRAMPS